MSFISEFGTVEVGIYIINNNVGKTETSIDLILF